MKLILKLLVILVLFSFSINFFAQGVQAQASGNCSRTGDTLTFMLSGAPQYLIRIDDLTTGWTGTPGGGDSVDTTTGTYTRPGVIGHAYNWWYHEVKDGKISSAISGGLVQCGNQISAPQGLWVTCTPDSMTFKWNTVPNATRYAIRIDDTTNPWGGNQPGDVINNNVSSTSHTISRAAGHNYDWWIHAVDANGLYSAPVGGPNGCPRS